MSIETSEAYERLVTPALHTLQSWGASRIALNAAPSSGLLPDITAACADTSLVAMLATSECLRQSATAAQWQAAYSRALQTDACFVVFAFLSDADDAQALLRRVCGSAANAAVWPV